MHSLEVSETREGVSFAADVAPDSEDSLEYSLNGPATIERISVRIYPGPENDLHITPLISRGSGSDIRLVQFEGKSFFDGDDDKWVFEPSKDVSGDDKIVVMAENLDASNEYSYRVNMDIDYRAGGGSFLGSLFGGGEE